MTLISKNYLSCKGFGSVALCDMVLRELKEKRVCLAGVFDLGEGIAIEAKPATLVVTASREILERKVLK